MWYNLIFYYENNLPVSVSIKLDQSLKMYNIEILQNDTKKGCMFEKKCLGRIICWKEKFFYKMFFEK